MSELPQSEKDDLREKEIKEVILKDKRFASNPSVVRFLENDLLVIDNRRKETSKQVLDTLDWPVGGRMGFPDTDLD